MEPIISPWIIYWIHVITGMKFISGLGLMLSVIGSTVLWAGVVIEENEDCIKPAKILTVIAAICAIMLIVIPDEKTIIAMLAASYITPDNIQLVQGNVVDFIRNIIEATK